MTTGVSQIQSGSRSFSISELVNLAEEGAIRVPKFQRMFVWDASDVRQLFDSLYRGFPVGTILLWQQPASAGVASFGPIDIEVGARSDAFWVVDGQQRVSSLYGSLSPRHKGLDDRFEVYFDLETGKFVNPRRGVVSSRSLPVREALETRALLNWLRQHEDDLESEDFDLADRLGGVLRDYKIPAYVVTGDDQNLLREIFDRVNSAGRPISRAQAFHALFASDEDPESPATVVMELRRVGFGSLDENRVVQSLLAIRGGDVQRDIHDEFGEGEDPADWYDRTEQALVRAIEFLRSEGVQHIHLMPNTLPLPVLAAFFYLHPEPSSWVLRLLARWLWRGWVHGFRDRQGGETSVLRKSVQSVHPKKGEPAEAPGEYEAVKSLLEFVPERETPVIPLNNFRTDWADGRLILLAMASVRPKGPDGNDLNLAGMLDEHGAKNAVTDFVSRRRSEAAARGFWPTDAPEITSQSAPVLESHLVSDDAAKALAGGDFESFLRLRGESLQSLVHQFLSNKVDVNGIIRPPLADLIAVGNAEDS